MIQNEKKFDKYLKMKKIEIKELGRTLSTILLIHILLSSLFLTIPIIDHLCAWDVCLFWPNLKFISKSRFMHLNSKRSIVPGHTILLKL